MQNETYNLLAHAQQTSSHGDYRGIKFHLTAHEKKDFLKLAVMVCDETINNKFNDLENL